MMNVKGEQLNAMCAAEGSGQMQQCGGIQAAAVCNCNSPPGSRNAREDCSKRAFESILDGRCLPVCHDIIPTY